MTLYEPSDDKGPGDYYVVTQICPTDGPWRAVYCDAETKEEFYQDITCWALAQRHFWEDGHYVLDDSDSRVFGMVANSPDGYAVGFPQEVEEFKRYERGYAADNNWCTRP